MGSRSANLWGDQCLVGAGGAPGGVIDVFQVHSYPKDDDGRKFHEGSPAHTNAADYRLERPVIIGEISNRWVEKPAGGEARPTTARTRRRTPLGSSNHRSPSRVCGRSRELQDDRLTP